MSSLMHYGNAPQDLFFVIIRIFCQNLREYRNALLRMHWKIFSYCCVRAVGQVDAGSVCMKTRCDQRCMKPAMNNIMIQKTAKIAMQKMSVHPRTLASSKLSPCRWKKMMTHVTIVHTILRDWIDCRDFDAWGNQCRRSESGWEVWKLECDQDSIWKSLRMLSSIYIYILYILYIPSAAMQSQTRQSFATINIGQYL